MPQFDYNFSFGARKLKIVVCLSYEIDLEKLTPSPPLKGRVLRGRIAPISSKLTVLELGS